MIFLSLVALVVIAVVAYVLGRRWQGHNLSRDQRELVQDRSAFLHLAANYLRGPVTLLVGAAENMSDSLDPQLAASLQALATSLQTKVAAIMKKLETNSQLNAGSKTRLSDQESELRLARQSVVTEAASSLDTDVTSLEKLLPNLPQSNDQVPLLTEGTRRLRQMINTFRLLTQIESLSTLPSSRSDEVVGLSGLMTRALHQSSAIITEKSLKIITPTQAELYLPGSPELIEFVISSILDNAVAFSPKNGTVTVTATTNARGTKLVVEDQGTGIAPDQLIHVFKPFIKASGNDELKLNHGGLGLSLYLDRIIMEAFGGTITAQSVVEHGTTITLTWPPTPTEAK
jgi:signal transduction histidine kinase